MPDKLIIV